MQIIMRLIINELTKYELYLKKKNRILFEE